jgi:hypothetical protein
MSSLYRPARRPAFVHRILQPRIRGPLRLSHSSPSNPSSLRRIDTFTHISDLKRLLHPWKQPRLSHIRHFFPVSEDRRLRQKTQRQYGYATSARKASRKPESVSSVAPGLKHQAAPQRSITYGRIDQKQKREGIRLNSRTSLLSIPYGTADLNANHRTLRSRAWRCTRRLR